MNAKKDIGALIAQRIPFKLNAVSAVTRHVPINSTELSESDRALYDLQADKVIYTFLYYKTPIVWYVTGVGWVFSESHYSKTISRHQSAVKRALDRGLTFHP